MSSSIFSYFIVAVIPTIIGGFYKDGHNDEKHNSLLKMLESLCIIWAVIFVFLGVLSIYHVKQDNRSGRLFPSYEAIQSHEKNVSIK